MQRPLVIVGASVSEASALAGAVASASGAELIELEAGGAGGDPATLLADARTRLTRAVELGGGRVFAVSSALLRRRAVRLQVLDAAVVVALDPVAPESGPQPDESNATLELRELESAVYEESHLSLVGATTSPTARVEATLRAWNRDGVAVAAGGRSYVVEIGQQVLGERIPELVGAAPVVCVVTDATVESLHGQRVFEPLAASGVTTTRHVLEPGERSKVMRSIVHVWNAGVAAGLDRGSLVIGFGGGVVTDTAGFAAATYMRGVRWVAVPTTLLAMVDASVGGKTGVDLRDAKNAVGAFWQPSAVVCDTDLLATEPARGFASALAEVIKTAIIGDSELLARLEEAGDGLTRREPALLAEIVRRCVRVKARIVSQDEREGGLRAVLNLGHTVGHALETLGEYHTLTHGEAVSLGLVAALRIGERRGVTPAELSARVVALLERVGLPTSLDKWDLERAAELLGHDKKRAGASLRFVFAVAPGRVTVERVGLSELRDEVRTLR